MSNTKLNGANRGQLSRYRLAGFFLISFLIFNFALRLVLFFAFKTDLPVSGTAAIQTFTIGLYRDFFVGLILAIPLLFWLFIVPNGWFAAKWHRRTLMGCLFLFWTIQSFSFMAEFFFFE